MIAYFYRKFVVMLVKSNIAFLMWLWIYENTIYLIYKENFYSITYSDKLFLYEIVDCLIGYVMK